MTISNSPFTLANTDFIAIASTSDGGALYSSTTLNVIQSRFILCFSHQRGGCIFCSSSLNLDNCIATKCTGLFSSCAFSNFGFLLSISQTSTIYCQSDNDGTVRTRKGCKIKVQKWNQSLSNSEGAHGGLFLEFPEQVNITQSIFEHQAGSLSAGLAFYQPNTISVCNLLFNNLTSKGDSSYSGMAIFIEDILNTNEINNCYFIDSSDPIYVRGKEKLILTQCCFSKPVHLVGVEIIDSKTDDCAVNTIKIF